MSETLENLLKPKFLDLSSRPESIWLVAWDKPTKLAKLCIARQVKAIPSLLIKKFAITIFCFWAERRFKVNRVWRALLRIQVESLSAGFSSTRRSIRWMWWNGSLMHKKNATLSRMIFIVEKSRMLAHCFAACSFLSRLQVQNLRVLMRPGRLESLSKRNFIIINNIRN